MTRCKNLLFLFQLSEDKVGVRKTVLAMGYHERRIGNVETTQKSITWNLNYDIVVLIIWVDIILDS